MEKTKITLQDNTPVDNSALYFIDWEKVQSVNELILIIASLGMSFSPLHPAWEQLKHLVDLKNPVHPGQTQPQQPKELKLPKLKTL